MSRREGGPGPGLRPLWRLLVVWVVAALTLLLVSALLPGFDVGGLGPAFVASALLGLLNALVWPVLVRLALPLTVLTLGLAPLALNAGMVALVAWALDGVTVDGFWWALAVAVAVTVVSMTLTAALALDDDDVVLRHLLRRRRTPTATEGDTQVPGVLFVQIDGLAHPVLQRAVRDGNAPTIAHWLAAGSHRLIPWTTGWSSQTGASQAGILMGSHHDMPAFRWYEKDTGKTYVSNRPRHAAALERRLSTGRGLLHADGASRGNIFTGDAEDSVLTMSSAGHKRGRIGAGYYAYFSQPYTAMRTLLGFVAEAVRERHQGRVQRRRDVLPRVHRGGVYPLLRAFTTVLSRDVIVATLVGDMRDGRSVVYADFVGYDEVAHHSGVERYDALEVLRRLDHELGRLVRAAAEVSRPYRIVVLSDHGQSQGATFRTRYGRTLSDLVSEACGRAVADAGEQDAGSAGEESWGYAGGALTEVAAGPGLGGRAADRATRGRRRDEDGDVLLRPEDAAPVTATSRTSSWCWRRATSAWSTCPMSPAGSPGSGSTRSTRSCCRPCARTRASGSCSSRPRTAARSCCPATASSSWPPARSAAGTRWPTSVRTRGPRSRSPTRTRTAPTSWSTRCGTPRPTRSRPSRSWWARTAAWAAPRPGRSSSTRPTSPTPGARSSGRSRCTSSCAGGWPTSVTRATATQTDPGRSTHPGRVTPRRTAAPSVGAPSPPRGGSR